MNNEYFIDQYEFNIMCLPIYILKSIFTFIRSNDDINNIRLSNKFFYNILEIVIRFNNNGDIIKKIYFKNHNPLKIIHYGYFNSKIYIKKICPMKNFKLNGNVLIYNHKKQLTCKSMISNNFLHGRTFFWKNNKLIVCLDYKKGKKHGNEIVLGSKKHKIYLSKYNDDMLITKETKEFNQIVSKTSFDKNCCQIQTKSKFIGPNKISIMNCRFHKTAIIHQNDRILHLQFVLGYLSGPQAVTTRDNQLKYIGTYSLNKPQGKYKCFNSKKMIEEGDIDLSVNAKYITKHNKYNIKKYKFNIFQQLDGYYTETDVTKNYTISFTNGLFDGLYYESYYLEDYWFKFDYYNENNYKLILKTSTLKMEINKIFGAFVISINYINLDLGNIINSLYLGKI